MTVNLVLITHDDIGTSLMKAATMTFGELPLPTTSVAVSYETDPEDLTPRLQQLAKTMTANCGVLVLTDLFGSTPCNIAQGLQDVANVRVISGLNLPMMIRVLNYPNLSLDELADKAISGGKEGIMACECDNHPQKVAAV
ncbi:MAG: PTS fructose transporter subunit IIA [Legionellales bacterium]|nr:PTS fructose transporter subunit IIA [Legionellales bacterium]|tara:strand:- start:14982 stop:15401 length:420 start_codon:yes stop_codon:yes gene_type:complete